MSRIPPCVIVTAVFLLSVVEPVTVVAGRAGDDIEIGDGSGGAAGIRAVVDPRRSPPREAGVIEGVLELDRVPPRRVAQRYPGAAAGPPRTVQPIPSVVWLRGPIEGAGGGGGAESGRPAVVAQRDTTFQPALLVVRRGETVAFSNRDPFFHNVFSYSGPARFDLGRYPRGQSKSVTFDEPGVVRVYCEVHDFMRAAVVVTENPYHARPDSECRFRISGVPPGTYTLVGWHAEELGRLGDSFNEMAQDLELKERYRGVLDKVVSREVAEELLRGDVVLGGENREVTTLFADVTGFTELSEGMEPQDVIHVLNQCMERLSAAVEAERGVVDKYVGDEIMAIFGAPVAHDGDDARRAVRAALRM